MKTQVPRLVTRAELERLRALLLPFSQDITVVAHMDDPARMLIRRYAGQLMEGRNRPLNVELDLVGRSDWWNAALATRPIPVPRAGQFGAVHWLDYVRLVQTWDGVFGVGSTRLFSLPRDAGGAALGKLMRTSFGLSGRDVEDPGPVTEPPSAAWLARCRLFNDALMRLIAQHPQELPRPLWLSFLSETSVPGAPADPGGLSAISDRFSGDIAALCALHPGLDPANMAPDMPAACWTEADPTLGFRATQYLLAFAPRLRKAARQAKPEGATPPPVTVDTGLPPAWPDAQMSPARPDAQVAPPVADVLPDLPPQALVNLHKLRKSPLAPHNDIGRPDEEGGLAPYPINRRAAPATGSGGTVIVACMKNEAPYILEWIAHHRAIGVDGFLIYTNDCEDGTDRIPDRLDALGIVQHRRNDDWTGKSPQQHALNRAIREPLVRNADWIIHIDVDEFINVRCGDGTLCAFLERVPDATNVAMTWRLFGHNGARPFDPAQSATAAGRIRRASGRSGAGGGASGGP